jgi:hypothetical protein
MHTPQNFYDLLLSNFTLKNIKYVYDGELRTKVTKKKNVQIVKKKQSKIWTSKCRPKRIPLRFALM